MKRWFVCALAPLAFGCDTGTPEATPETSPEVRAPVTRKLDANARRVLAEDVVAKAKARENREAFDEVALAPEEEEAIKKAAAAEVDAEDVAGSIDALEAELQRALEAPAEKP